MTVANIIYNQLGGNKFVVMTGSKNFLDDGNTLRMALAKNASKANLAINQELYPAEHWEMALMYDDSDTILLN